MDVRKYWTQCRLHDWHYEMSDDPEVYRNGKDSEDYLLSIAHEDPAIAEVFLQWQAYHYYSGPRPAEPKMED
jgi:predicted hydrolase (HD superfamily)